MNYFKNLFKGISKPLLLLPMALAIISITMMFSTSYRNGIVFSREVLIQSFAYFLGFILIIIIANMDYSVFQDFEKLLYIGSLVLLLLVYIPFVGVEQFGARSWINLGFMYFQPSEVVKITFILLFANYLQKHRDSLYSFKEIMKAAIYCAPFIAIILKEDLGSALVFLAVWVTMVFYAGIDYRLFAKCAGVTLLCIPISYRFMAAHQKVRIEAFLHPSNLALEGNYQVYQSKIAIGSGGFFGKGLFQGTQKELEFLPVRNSDFIFSVIVEELGFIGGALVIGIYSWLVFVMAKVAMLCKDFYGSLIVMGIIGMFTFQIFENIAMTMGIMPVTGITLPFLSYGGSSIISNMIALGFVINVAIKNRGVIF
ncbi:MAG: rod shape-determining protein RodA [Anaerovoracaceae bacterium]